MRGRKRKVVLIAGPTASGKSAFALKKARETGGVVINADSMQVYAVLRILTARPAIEEMGGVSHYLYGHIPPTEHYSTGRWTDDVRQVMDDPSTGDRPLIFTGGTGLYFRALLQGMSPMPDIPREVRARWRSRLHEEGAQTLHRILQEDDPDAAMALRPGDSQRILRALEVLEVSGRSITSWQTEAGQPLVDAESVERFVIAPDREVLYRNIETRLDRMIEAGALTEVEQLLSLNIDAAMPAMKAIGVRELSEVLAGRADIEQAIVLAKTATRQYAKRQMTWFRNQLDTTWTIIGRP